MELFQRLREVIERGRRLGIMVDASIYMGKERSSLPNSGLGLVVVFVHPRHKATACRSIMTPVEQIDQVIGTIHTWLAQVEITGSFPKENAQHG